MAVSDLLLRGKTNRTVWLKYTFTVAGHPAALRVESERMNARRVWLNGREIGLPQPGSFDPAFVSADILPLVKPGENQLVYEIGYYQSEEVYRVFNGVYYEHSDGTESLINCLSYLTDIEAVYLRGDFSVKAGALRPGERNTLIAAGDFSLAAPVTRAPANALAANGYPFFGGRMTMTFRFTGTGRETALRLSGRFMLAKVRLNGGAEQTLLFDSRADIAGQVRPGENELAITLVSGYRNVFGPFHWAASPEPLSVSPDLFSGYGAWREGGVSDRYAPTYAFTRFGLTGIAIG